ncbi:MAG: FecR domain-containing protein, partial [Planctomycetota bacterium]
MTDPWILMSAYFDQVLNEKQALELCEWIKKDTANARLFARQAFIHRGIYEMLTGEDIQQKITMGGSELSSADNSLDLEELSRNCLKGELAEYEKDGVPVEVERVDEPVERILTQEEREAKVRAFLREEKAKEEQERRLEEETRRKIRERELKRRQRAQVALNVATKVRRYARNIAIAAMLMVIGYLVYTVMNLGPPAFVATLTDGINVKWADSAQPAQLDRLLRPELMKLVEGYAEITFHGGAKVIIEGPVEIELQGIDKAHLQRGKMSVIVPVEARGFAVNSPSASIVDLGTEFAVHVKEDGSSDIHVFEGKVSLLAGKIDNIIGKLFDTVEQIVEAGQAKRIQAGSSMIDEIQFSSSKFVRNMPLPDELAVRQSDPVIYYRFNETEEILSDRVERGGRPEIAPVDLNLGDGLENSALHLKGTDSYIAIQGPAQEQPQKLGTVMMWLKVESPDNVEEHSILSTVLNDSILSESSVLELYNNALYYEYTVVGEGDFN